MDMKVYLTWKQIHDMVVPIVNEMDEDLESVKIYGIPRGGNIIAGLLSGYTPFDIVNDPSEADLLVDDIYDSGATALEYSTRFPDKEFLFLVDKRLPEWKGKWIVFPWEESAEKDIEHHVTRILEYLGEDPNRDGLKDTPRRVVKSWKEIYGGYAENPADILSTAFDNDGSYDEMVILKDISFHSMCEHHMLPFIGKAHIAYIPKADGKVVGISKLARLVECFGRRLQIQEKMTSDIAKALEEHLNTEGVAVVIEAQHLCMKMRGVKNESSFMRTSSLSGVFKSSPATRAEFLSLIQ